MSKKKKSKGVRYGVRNVHVAWFDEETEQYDTPLALPGCRSIKTSPEGDTKKWFADDTVYYVGRANNGYTADLEMAKVALEVMAAAQGWELDPETGVLYEVTDGEEVNKPFALLYEVEGDVTNTRFCYYYVTMDRPENEWSTTEDSVEPTTETVSVSIDPLAFGDKHYVKAMCELTEKSAAVFDSWFKKVHTPPAAATPDAGGNEQGAENTEG